MIARVIRLRQAWLRLPLLCMVFPFVYLDYATQMLLFHPVRSRLRERELWLMPIAVFWAAWDGDFVDAMAD